MISYDEYAWPVCVTVGNSTYLIPADVWRISQRARQRSALLRARDVTWMMGNRHVWMPKPTKAEKVRRQQCRLRQRALP